MRVLLVTPYLPVPPNFGGARRMHALIREIGRRHEVITLSLASPGDDVAAAIAEIGPLITVPVRVTARQPGNRYKRAIQLRSLLSPRSFQYALYHQPRLQLELDRLVKRGSFDVIQWEFSQMVGAYRLPPNQPTVLDIHNVEHDLLRQVATVGPLAARLFNMLEFRKYRREEIAAWRRATVNLVTSEDDGRVVTHATGRPARVIPNGVDLDIFQPQPLTAADPVALVFVGALRYRPNADAARFFVDAILPRLRERLPGVSFTIVGADPPPEIRVLSSMPGVTVTGTVEDVRPFLGRAGVVVVPLRAGGGTRLKILEAFAMGRPVVSTTIGAAGLDVRDGEHLLLADAPGPFIEAIERLAHDPELRERLVAQALDLVSRQYDWGTIGAELASVYAEVAP